MYNQQLELFWRFISGNFSLVYFMTKIAFDLTIFWSWIFWWSLTIDLPKHLFLIIFVPVGSIFIHVDVDMSLMDKLFLEKKSGVLKLRNKCFIFYFFASLIIDLCWRFDDFSFPLWMKDRVECRFQWLILCQFFPHIYSLWPTYFSHFTVCFQNPLSWPWLFITFNTSWTLRIQFDQSEINQRD